MEKTLLNNVFVAARAEGKTARASIDAIKACKLDWADLKQVEAVALAYKAGRVTTALALKSENAALAIMALKPHKDGAGDGHRTLLQHMAVRNAINAWSNIRSRAGAPSAQNGQARKPRQTVAGAIEAKEATTLPDNLLPAITRAKSVADVHAYALRMAGNITKYINANSKLVKGDIGSLLRTFPGAVAKACEESIPQDTAKAA